MFGCFSAGALAFNPTPAQIEQFKQLSPQEQKKLADSLGVQVPTGLNTPTTVAPEAPQTVMPRKAGFDEDTLDQEMQPSTAEKKAREKNKEFDEFEEYQEKEYQPTTGLKPYGYDLFAGSPTTFAPATDIPVPVDYVIGPGDTIIVQLYGKENSTQELAVSREGVIQFPEIGPVSVNGLNFGELKARIDELVSEQMIGIKASITMGALRSIRIFVLGEAFRPGSYTVSALSTMTNALFASGGVKEIGSLRNIQLKRSGDLIATLDLYDLLMHGNTNDDIRLQPGDVLFIPPLKKTAAVTGDVRRPAIYELKSEQVAADLIKLAGGYLPTAYPQASRVERIDHKGNRTVHDIDLSTPKGRSKTLRNGDLIQVYSVLDKLENVVVLSGHVHRPGYFKWRKGMKVSDLVGEVADLKRHADLDFALLKHQSGPQGFYQFERVQLGAALNKSTWANIELQPRDELIVLGGANDRADVMIPFNRILEQQAEDQAYPKVVTIQGNVKFPGEYPLLKSMSVPDLLAAAGGALPETFGKVYHIQRDAETGFRKVSLLALDTPEATNQRLTAYDEVYVFGANEPRAALLEGLNDSLKAQASQGLLAQVMAVQGAVEFPGQYPFVPGITMAEAIELAGGLAENAFGLSAEVTHHRINGDNEFEVAHQPLDLQKTDETGLGYQLKPKDQVIIKQIPNWNEVRIVTLKGEVKFPGEYPISSGETLSQVIARAGGLTEFGDAKGAVFLRESLKEKEEEALKKFKGQIEKEVAQLESEAQATDDALAKQKAVAAQLMQDLESAQATGRLVIDLPSILAGNDMRDVILRENDQILIPTKVQEVSIVGEVQFPTSHLYVDNLSVKKYLNKSGWLTRNADKKRIYMIGRDGNVRPFKKWRFLFFTVRNKAEAGDTIVVPMEVGKVGALQYWTAVSDVLFKLATTAAALETVGAI